MKTMILSLSLSGLMVACGSSHSSNNQQDAVPAVAESANNKASVALGSDGNDPQLVAELGNCDDSKRAQVCFSNNTNAYYYCTVSGNWSVTQIFPTTPTTKLSPENGNCIGAAAPKGLDSIESASVKSDNTWTSPKTGLIWQFGNSFAPTELTTNNARVWDSNFICPVGTIAPTQAQLEAEFSSSFIDWIGNQFLLVGMVNESYNKSYYMEVADAQGNFDLINAMQVTAITGVCIQK